MTSRSLAVRCARCWTGSIDFSLDLGVFGHTPVTTGLRMRDDVERELQFVLDFDGSAGDRHRLDPKARLLQCECSLRTQQLVAKFKLRRYCQLLRYSMKRDLARYASLILSLTGSGSADAAALESDLR